MAAGTKKNFRCADDAVWEKGLAKAGEMRRAGYDVDMTLVINLAVRQFADETPDQSAERLALTSTDEPVPLYRKPVSRAAGDW